MERTTIGPYRITDRLGVGGMGEVFKAYDDRLDRWVAIKKILPDKEDDQSNRERLRREARAAAKLNHPSIVQVYDIFQDGEHDCIVMEYVEGSTLDRLVANGRLPVPDLVRAGRQVAEGLAEAHEKKILHRDLKTENIIITPSGQAKILDFGLAKALRGSVDPALTAHDQMVGTSRALSPEYASGDEIDHRSDLFQLGILLYEASTGHSPFRAHNTLATLKRVILHHQTPAREINPEIPAELSDLVDQLLEKEPDDRPASARLVAEELGRIAEKVISGEHEAVSNAYISRNFAVPPTSSTNISRKRQRLWLATLLGLMTLVAVGFYVVGQRSAVGSLSSPPEESVPVLLLEFDSQLTEDEMLGSSLHTALEVGLKQARFINLVPREVIEDALVRMEVDPSASVDRDLGVEIGKREGIPRLVEGQIVKIGSNYKLSVTLIDPADSKSVLTETATARSEDDLIPELDQLVKKVRRGLGEVLSESDQSLKPLEKVTTRNLKALEAYSQGIAQFEAQNEEEAASYFKRAIELDPEFAMAFAKLGTTYRNLGRSPQLVDQQFEEALLHTDRLTEVERLYVRGWRAMRHAAPDEIIEVWKRMSELYPGESAGHYNLGSSLKVYKNDFEGAADAFEKSARAGDRGRKLLAYSEMALCYLALGRMEDALGILAEVQALRQEVGSHFHTAWEMVGDFEESLRYFEESLPSLGVDEQAASMVRLSVSYAAEGRINEAIHYVREARSLLGDDAWLDYVSRLSLVLYYQRWGRADDLETELTELIGIATRTLGWAGEGELTNFEKNVITLGAIVGKLAIDNGKLEEAREIFSLIEGLGVLEGADIWAAYGLMLEGELLLADGEHRPALARLNESLAIFESLQVQESLARVHQALGNLQQAAGKYEWILSLRGRAYVECTELCFDWGLNITSWPVLHLEAAELYEELGEPDRARELYLAFLEHWQGADDREDGPSSAEDPYLQLAWERLAALPAAEAQ